MLNKNIHKIINNKALILFLLVSACSTHTGRYQQKYDSTPSRIPTTSELKDATPRLEPKSKGGNKNYQVRGKQYSVLPSAENFTQTGIASWYGNKFHGHLTSNGEIYNMYSMSAAHKNLPLPTYVKVTNNENNKSVIVRVNDRGPFHQNRIIDLSYSAAYKLDMLKKGTAVVTIETIKTNPSPLPFKPSIPFKISTNGYIQVFATQNKTVANNKANTLKTRYSFQVSTPLKGGVYRIKVGPFKTNAQLEKALTKIRNNGYPKAFKSYINQ